MSAGVIGASGKPVLVTGGAGFIGSNVADRLAASGVRVVVFDNLVDVEDAAIQLILKEIDTASLTIALKGASEELCAKFFKNMSNRAAEILRDDLDAQGPVRMSRVETEQKAILMVARKLADAGQINLSMGNDEYV